MLPACRTAGDVFTIPQFALDPRDVEGFRDELHGFHTALRECFARREPRDHFFHYMVGQLSDLERKSIEPMALQVEGGNVRAMPRGIRDAVWDDAQMRQTYHRLGHEDMGDPAGGVSVDESGFPPKGHDSVGVARQSCGPLGKVDNCQVGVFAAYASRQGYALVAPRLFMPEPWVTDAYARRRTQCQVPQTRGFQTKPPFAVAMLRARRDEGGLPFTYGGAACLYGHSPEFLEAVAEEARTISCVSIPADPGCWLQGPVMQTRQYTYTGARRTKRVVSTLEKAPSAVETLAKSLHNGFWYRRKVAEGTTGPIEDECTKPQGTLCHDGRPTRTVWLVRKRTLGANPSYWYYVSNAPVSTR
jgi:SRSO17 transposase